MVQDNGSHPEVKHYKGADLHVKNTNSTVRVEIMGYNEKEIVGVEQIMALNAVATAPSTYPPIEGKYQWIIPGTNGTDYEYIENTTPTSRKIKIVFHTPGANKEIDVRYTTGEGISVLSERVENDKLVSDKVILDVVKVDLEIYNGGSDLDNGEETGQQGEKVEDDDEEEIGAYIFVNWDDDDDGQISGGIWTKQPVPDLNEESVENEDNLAKLLPTIEPLPGEGIVELTVVGGVNKIKLWTQSFKETEVTLTEGKKTWNISNPEQKSELQNFMTNALWMEGLEWSNEREVVITLKYKNKDGEEICSDTIKVTVVNINIPCALYRHKMWDWLQINYWHTGIAIGYTGSCTKDNLSIDNIRDYIRVFDMRGNGIRDTNMTTFVGNLEYYGSTGINDLTDVERLKIIGTAKFLLDAGIEYPPNYPPYAVLIDGGRVPDENELIVIGEISHLRCDGLVEVCFENNANIVWWAIKNNMTYENIMAFPYYHNDRPDLTYDPEFELSPMAQSGLAGNDNTHFNNIEICEPTIFKSD